MKNQSQPTGDPLLGNPVPRAAGSAVNPPPPVAAASPNSTSVAALTPGTTALEGGRELRIAPQPQPPPPPAGVGWGGQGNLVARGPDPAAPVAPAPPQPRLEPRPVTPPPAATPLFPNLSLNRGTTSEQSLLATIRARGANWQRLETWGDEGEWKFSCSIPNPANIHIRRTYEARARDPLQAMRAVIEQIDREQR